MGCPKFSPFPDMQVALEVLAQLFVLRSCYAPCPSSAQHKRRPPLRLEPALLFMMTLELGRVVTCVPILSDGAVRQSPVELGLPCALQCLPS